MAYNRTNWVNDSLPAINAENLNKIENAIEEANNFIDQLYKIGDLFLTTNSENPSIRFGGTWELFGKGKTLICVDEEDEDFNEVNKTGGEKTHTLTVNEMPSHNHPGIIGYTNTTGYYARLYEGSQGTKLDGEGKTGGDQPHNNLQPYITCYIWVRTA